jgi:hypothetical protein
VSDRPTDPLAPTRDDDALAAESQIHHARVWSTSI